MNDIKLTVSNVYILRTTYFGPETYWISSLGLGVIFSIVVKRSPKQLAKHSNHFKVESLDNVAILQLLVKHEVISASMQTIITTGRETVI